MKGKGQEIGANKTHGTLFSLFLCELKANESRIIDVLGSKRLNERLTLDYNHSHDLELKPGTYAVLLSLQKGATSGKIFISVYYDCPKEEISLQEVDNPEAKGNVIREEEEDDEKFPDELKLAVQQVLVKNQ